MRKIDHTNYEAWILDHIERRLNAEERESLRIFLLNNGLSPLDEFEELPALNPENIEFESKQELTMDFSPTDSILIAYLEGTAGSEEIRKAEKQIKENIVAAKDFELFKKTRLEVDEGLHFAGKDILRKSIEPELADETLQYFEGCLDEAGFSRFESRMRMNRDVAQDLRLLSYTKLVPGEEVFPDKESLKKRTRVVGLFAVARLSVAAALLIATCVFVFRIYDREPLRNDLTAKDPVASQTHKTQPDQIPAKNISKVSEDPLVAVNGLKKPSVSKRTILSAPSPVENESLPAEESLVEAPHGIHEPVEEQITDRQSGADETFIVVNDQLPMEEDTGDFDLTESGKKSFWRRAAVLAGHANRVGIKAVDGEVQGDEGFRFTLSSFSIRKN